MPDSFVVERRSGGLFSRSLPEDHSPRGALWRAAAVPGWGQYYNRQYLKLPIVYAGLIGVGALAYVNNRDYLTFRHAYLYAEHAGKANPDPAFREAYREDYFEALERLGVRGEDTAEGRGQYKPYLKANREALRRNRDLSYFGVGVVYAVSILDAYVAAHLLDFDIGEDLTFTVVPAPKGAAAALRWSF